MNDRLGDFFLNRWTFYYQTWFGDASLWARLSFKKIGCCLQGQVTVTGNIIKIWLCNMSSELLILLQLNLVWWYIITRGIVLWKDWNALLWSRSGSQERFRIPVHVHLDSIPSAAEPSVTKLGMVMQHHGPKCHARRLVFKLSSSKSQWGFICWTVGVFATKFNWMGHRRKQECFV